MPHALGKPLSQLEQDVKTTHCLCLILVTTCLVTTCLASPIGAQEPVAGSAPQQAMPDSVFGMKHVWEVHLQFDPEQWQAIQPPDDVNWDPGAAFRGVIEDAKSGGNFHSENSSRPGLAGYMGVDHQYGTATVTIGEDTIENVGVR